MPRTKVSRNSKRNREAALREEKIREFDSTLEQSINAFDMKIKQDMQEIDTEIVFMKTRIPEKVLLLKFGDLIKLKVATFSDIKPASNFAKFQLLNQQSQTSQLLKRSRDDEGYQTEDSRGSGAEPTMASLLQMRSTANANRFVGPLNSAKARRRSRSACSYTGNLLKPMLSHNSARISRQKQRTPLITRQKAASADRSVKVPKYSSDSPTALLRWPKPGEMVISMTGSPVVANVMPNPYANVNIPIRDGVLSLRPKKLQNLDPELVHKIDQETLDQIKQLQSNLELIMSYAHTTEKVKSHM